MDSTGSGDETQVSISGYLMPGLQLQYGMGVFTSISEVRLRYELMPRLYVQVLSGLNQALDLFYKAEERSKTDYQTFQQESEAKSSLFNAYLARVKALSQR